MVQRIHPPSLYQGTTQERGNLSLPIDGLGATFWDYQEERLYIWNDGWVLVGDPGSGGDWYSNPMTNKGDMIYQAYSTEIPYNWTIHDFGVIATAFTEVEAPPGMYFYPAMHVLRSHEDYDLFQNQKYVSESFKYNNLLDQWLKIDLGAERDIDEWRMKQLLSCWDDDGVLAAKQYDISGSHNGTSWTPIVTHTAQNLDETIEFSSTQTYRYFWFEIVTTECAFPLASAWKVEHLFLFEYIPGLQANRLPIGSEDDVLTVSGSGVPGWEVPQSDMTKAVYDTNDDGVVNEADNADTVDSQHASEFALVVHTHVETDVTNLDHDAEKIQGADVPAPSAGDDEKGLIYNHGTGDFEYGEVGEVDLETIAVITNNWSFTASKHIMEG